jgi:hypothetical protein
MDDGPGSNNKPKKGDYVVRIVTTAIEAFLKGHLADEQKNDSNKQIAEETQKLAIYTRRVVRVGLFTGLLTFGVLILQWRTLEKTDATFNKTLIAANRAWVVPYLVKLIGTPTDGHQMDLFFTYGNTGHEPATRVGYNSNSWSIPIDVIRSATPETATDSLKKAIEAKLTDTCSAAKSNENLVVMYPATSGVSNNSTPINVDPKWITQPIIDYGFVVAEGCFVYRTMDDWHKSRFCFFWNKIMDGWKPPEGKGFLFTCPAGNEAK